MRGGGEGAFRLAESAPVLDGCKPNSVGPRVREPEEQLSHATPGGVASRSCGEPRNQCDYYPGDSGQAAQLPVLSCTAWGFSCPGACALGGELLPRLFTLTGVAPGGLFSVTLSVAAGLRRRPPRIVRGMLPFGVRTFLQRFPAGDHPPSSWEASRSGGGESSALYTNFGPPELGKSRCARRESDTGFQPLRRVVLHANDGSVARVEWRAWCVGGGIVFVGRNGIGVARLPEGSPETLVEAVISF